MNPANEQTETTATETAPSATTEVSAEVLSTLAEIGEEVNSSLDLDEVLARTAALIKRHIDYEIFGVMMLEGDGSVAVSPLLHRLSAGASNNLQIPIGQGITGTAAATGRAVRVAERRRSAVHQHHRFGALRAGGAADGEGKSIGVLDIQSTQVDYFTRDQQSILTLMASRLAIAIENARLFERVRAQADTLLVLNEVGREANSILEVEELLRRAAELVKRVIDYQILGILLYDEDRTCFATAWT